MEFGGRVVVMGRSVTHANMYNVEVVAVLRVS